MDSNDLKETLIGVLAVLIGVLGMIALEWWVNYG